MTKRKKQSSETNFKVNQMLELAEMDFKAATINTHMNIKEDNYGK